MERFLQKLYDKAMDVSIARPALWNRAVMIFGSEQKAARWLRTRLSELNDRTPEETLDADANTDAVDAILDRIEYGVFG